MDATVELKPSITPTVPRAVETSADTKSATLEGLRKEQDREAWQREVEKLLEWLREPRQLEDEGVELPTGTILRLSIDLAERLRNDGHAPPDSVVPDPNGGVVFERRTGDASDVIHIWEDGTVEYQRFHGTRLVERRPY